MQNIRLALQVILCDRIGSAADTNRNPAAVDRAKHIFIRVIVPHGNKERATQMAA